MNIEERIKQVRELPDYAGWSVGFDCIVKDAKALADEVERLQKENADLRQQSAGYKQRLDDIDDIRDWAEDKD